MRFPMQHLHGRSSQRGAVLFVALVFLLLLTLLGVTASSTSILQERMTGGMRNAHLAGIGTESGLRGGEVDLWAAAARSNTASGGIAIPPCASSGVQPCRYMRTNGIVELGDVMVGGTVCEVLASRSERRAVGDIVLAYTGWQTHAVAEASDTRKLDPQAAPISTALGVLGMPGFTAYAGLLEIGRPAPGETVVVAAATGPVGSAVGQIASLKGARTVGIAGGPDRGRYRELR